MGQMIDLALVTIEMVITVCFRSGSPEVQIFPVISGSLGIRQVDTF